MAQSVLCAGVEVLPSTLQPAPAGLDEFEEDGAGSCAICLNTPEPVDEAIIKGCQHTYCAHCILQWALTKDVPWCPQCKAPFNYLFVYRQLDGTIFDFPVEESVCLLKRARWFEERVKTCEGVKTLGKDDADEASAALAAAMAAADWVDPEEEWEDEDEAIEQYYFSAAAGRARVVLGNRRWGENGAVKAGRQYARPIHHAGGSAGASGSGSSAAASASTSTPGSSGKSIGKAGGGRKQVQQSSSATGGSGGSGTPAAAGSMAAPASSGGSTPAGKPCTAVKSSANGTPGGASAVAGSATHDKSVPAAAAVAGSSHGKGRRAQRNARRAQVDEDDQDW